MNLAEIFENNEPPHHMFFLNDIAEAVLRVEEKYCNWACNYYDYKQQTERVFAYEFYHQFRQLTFWRPEYQALRLDGEIIKLLFEVMDGCGVALNNINLNQEQFSPDFVLHLDQRDRNLENQKIIIEIKTKLVDKTDTALTILKLNHYLKLLNFQYGVFISVNTSIDDLCHLLNLIFDDPTNFLWEDRFKRIIIFNYVDRVLTVKTLFKILKPN